MKFRHLRTKIIVASFPVLLLGAAAFFVASDVLLLPGFQKIEDQAAINNASRAVDALNNRIAQINRSASDWGDWNDAYAFVKTPSQTFIKDDLANQTLGSLGIDYILFYNTNNQLIEMKHVEIDDPALPSKPLDPGMKALLSPSSPLLNHATITDVHQGLVIIPEGIVMLVSRPILTSEGTGPSRGSVVFAQFLGPADQTALANLTHLKLKYMAADSPEVTGSVPAYPSTTTQGTQWVSRVSASGARAFAIIPDIYGRPTIAAEVELSRTISEEGFDSMQTFLLVSLVVGLLTIITSALLINGFIVSRIVELSRQLQDINEIPHSLKAVTVKGHDELGNLGSAINDLLARIYNLHDLKQTNSDLEQSVAERTKELNSQLEQMKRVNGLMVDRELRMKELKQQNAKLRDRLGDD